MKENNMKPKRSHKNTGPAWQGKGVSTGGDKATLSQAMPTCVASPAQVKPFAGKLFYLDLPSNRIAETLERDIKDLGGTVEKFFSKEIKYLVSNKREARYVQCLRQDSPVPSPESGPSSPHPRSNPHRPSSYGDNTKSRSQGHTDTFVPSRGKSLVERVVKEQERVKINKILSNALEWGVKILYIDDIIAYIQKKKKIISTHCPANTAVKTNVKAETATKQSFQKCKGGRISKPFIKVEDSSRHYRPIYLTMPNLPEFNLKTLPPFTPFCVEDKDPPGKKQQGHSEERAHGRKKNRDKKRGGYCECCMVKYENVTAHLKSERHKTFSKSDEYLVVDKLVSALHCNFMHIKTHVKRPKCSVSSVLMAPGPCGKTTQRRKEFLDTTEIFKEEQQRTVDGSPSEHTLKLRTAAVSVPVIQRKTHTDRSKHRSLARKRPSRQVSLTSCAQIDEQAPSLQPKMETAPSSGEHLHPVLTRVTEVIKVDEVITQDISNSPLRDTNEQSKVSSVRLNVVINQQEDRKQESSVCEVVQDGNTLPDKMNHSEKEPASLPSQSFSPARKIQRRVRVYKRKRRKVDTRAEHVKQNEFTEDSTVKLLQLFQSSDDMDVEFLGFEDQEEPNELKG